MPTDLFCPRDRAQTRTLLELPLQKTILLYMGRIDPYSKSDLFPLLLAYRNLWQKHPDKLLLLLVGPVNETYLPKLETLRQELGLPSHSLQLRSNVAKGCVPLYYAAADLFVSLSDTLQENFGLTPVEAMASGLPVVVTDWAGYRESVKEGETGFKVPTFWGPSDADLNEWAPFYDWSFDHFYVGQSVGLDHQKLIEGLSLLVENEALRHQMGERARAYALQEYSWEVGVKRLWEAWVQLAKEAETLEDEMQKEDYRLLQPRYYETFGCFASYGLSGAERLTITQRGLKVLKGQEPLGQIEEPRGLLKEEWVLRGLRGLRTLCRWSGSVSVARLVELLRRCYGVNDSEGYRYVLWMLKYDLAALTCRPRSDLSQEILKSTGEGGFPT